MVGRKIREFGFLEKPALAPGAWERLQSYDWPGNVRELENLVERELILWRGGELHFSDLSGAALHKAVPGDSTGSPIHTLDEALAHHIRLALSAAQGKVQGPGGAAEILSLNPNTLRKRMRKLGIPFGRKARHIEQ